MKKKLEQTKTNSYFYFLCILDSGELCSKGDRGFLGESLSLKLIFPSIGLLVWGLLFRLFPCTDAKVNHVTTTFSMPSPRKQTEIQKNKMPNDLFCRPHLCTSATSAFFTRTRAAPFSLVPQQPFILLVQYFVFLKQHFHLRASKKTVCQLGMWH